MSSSKSKRIWKDKEIIPLIQMYESLPELWNVNHSDYKDRFKKAVALETIAEAFDTTTDEIRKKFHNLRSQISAELRRNKKRNAELGVDEDIFHSEWKYFNHLKFLMGDVTNGNGGESKPMKRFRVKSDSEGSEDFQESNDSMNTRQMIELTPITHHPEKVYLNSNELSTPTATEEDHRIFGEYIASELRNLSERNAKKLKLMIKKSILEVTEEEFQMEDF